MAYATATSTQDLSLMGNLHHSLQQHQIPYLLSKARDQTHISMDIIRICFHCATMETPCLSILNVLVSISLPQTPSPPPSLVLGNCKTILYVCKSVSVSQVGSYFKVLFLFVCFFVFVFLGLHPWHMEVSQARVLIGAIEAGLCHSNTRSKPCLQPTPQLMATPGP